MKDLLLFTHSLMLLQTLHIVIFFIEHKSREFLEDLLSSTFLCNKSSEDFWMFEQIIIWVWKLIVHSFIQKHLGFSCVRTKCRSLCIFF